MATEGSGQRRMSVCN